MTATLLAADTPLLRPDVLLAFGLVGGVLLAGAVAVHFVDRWRKNEALTERTPDDDLSSFRAMFERGELTEAEYDKVRKRAAERMKQKLGVAHPPTPPPTPPPEPPAPEAG